MPNFPKVNASVVMERKQRMSLEKEQRLLQTLPEFQQRFEHMKDWEPERKVVLRFGNQRSPWSGKLKSFLKEEAEGFAHREEIGAPLQAYYDHDLNDPPHLTKSGGVNSNLDRIMGSRYSHVSERRYMKTLARRLYQGDIEKETKKLRARAVAEEKRVREQVITRKVPGDPGTLAQIKDHPFFKVNQLIRRLELMRIKIEAEGGRVPKVPQPSITPVEPFATDYEDYFMRHRNSGSITRIKFDDKRDSYQLVNGNLHKKSDLLDMKFKDIEAEWDAIRDTDDEKKLKEHEEAMEKIGKLVLDIKQPPNVEEKESQIWERKEENNEDEKEMTLNEEIQAFEDQFGEIEMNENDYEEFGGEGEIMDDIKEMVTIKKVIKQAKKKAMAREKEKEIAKKLEMLEQDIEYAPSANLIEDLNEEGIRIFMQDRKKYRIPKDAHLSQFMPTESPLLQPLNDIQDANEFYEMANKVQQTFNREQLVSQDFVAKLKFPTK